MKDVYKEIQLKNGRKLILRKPSVKDAENLIEYFNAVGGESDHLLFGKDEFEFTIEQHIEYIKRLSKDMNALMVLGTINDTSVSVGQISSSKTKRVAHNSEICISVKKEYWRNGIGSIVMKELIQFAKEHSKIKTVSLGVKASNISAIRMYEKFGFKQIGVHKDYFKINGNYHDEILMDLHL